MIARRLTKVVGAIVVGLVIVAGGPWLVLKLAAPDLVQEQATSTDGRYAEVIVDGVPLSDGTRVVVWMPRRPHWTLFGCIVLEAYHEQPVKLSWKGESLQIDHAYASDQIISSRSHCSSTDVTFARTLKTYS